MNIYNYENCSYDCNPSKEVDSRFIPKNFDITNIFHPCPNDCRPEPCHDIREGIFEFTGPKEVRSLCDLTLKCGVMDDGSFDKNSQFKKSFAIYKVGSVEGCDRIVNAVWRNPQHSTTIKCAGDYYIKYQWDACIENEPQFEATDICCDPCNS